MALTIKDLALSVRVTNALGTDMLLDQFMLLTKADVTKFKNIGRTSWMEVQNMQEHLSTPTREEKVRDLKYRLRQLNLEAQELGLVLITHDGCIRLARIYAS